MSMTTRTPPPSGRTVYVVAATVTRPPAARTGDDRGKTAGVEASRPMASTVARDAQLPRKRMAEGYYRRSRGRGRRSSGRPVSRAGMSGADARRGDQTVAAGVSSPKAVSNCSAGRKPTAARGGSPGAKEATGGGHVPHSYVAVG